MISDIFLNLVGVERFELPTHCSQSSCATRLRYTPFCPNGANNASVGKARNHTLIKKWRQLNSSPKSIRFTAN